MGYQDDVTNDGTHGRVDFIFSSLIASYADSQPGLGRTSWRHGLKNLTDEAAVSLLSGKSKEVDQNMHGPMDLRNPRRSSEGRGGRLHTVCTGACGRTRTGQ